MDLPNSKAPTSELWHFLCILAVGLWWTKRKSEAFLNLIGRNAPCSFHFVHATRRTAEAYMSESPTSSDTPYYLLFDGPSRTRVFFSAAIISSAASRTRGPTTRWLPVRANLIISMGRARSRYFFSRSGLRTSVLKRTGPGSLYSFLRS